VFKRKPQHEAGKLPLDTLIAKMPHSIIPEDQRVKYMDSDESEYEWQYESSEDDVVRPVPPPSLPYLTSIQSGWNEKYPRDPNAVDVLDVPAPPNAFPTIYPPEDKDSPFPKGWKRCFPAPQWYRRPAKASTKRPPMMDFEEFIELFSRMSVKEGQRKRRRVRKSQDPAKRKKTSPPHPKPDRSAATIFITTKPLSAPLAAFVRPKPVSEHFLTPVLPTIPAPSSRKCAFASPYSASTPATLVPTPLPSSKDPLFSKEQSLCRRKIAPLPKRVPNGPSTAHRAVTRTESDTSVSSSSTQGSPSPSSRSPSSGSASSKRRHLSSDSSAGTEVATPEASSLSLPATIPPSVLSMTRFEFNSPSNMSDLFYDSPQVGGLQLEFPSSATYGAEGSSNKAPYFDFDHSFSSDPLHAQS
jgi:hypothetical protein